MRRSLTCAKAQQMIEETFDDSLDEQERYKLDSHLSQCNDCQIFCQSASTVRDILESQPDVYPSDTAIRKMRAKLEHFVSQEPIPQVREKRNRLRMVAIIAAAACLCLLSGAMVAMLASSSPSPELVSLVSVASAPNSVHNDEAEITPVPVETIPVAARVSEVTGELIVQRGEENVALASRRISLQQGDRVETADDGLTVINLAEEVQLALAPSTAIELQRLSESAHDVRISSGWIVCSVEPNRDIQLQIQAAETTIRVVGTVFAVEFINDGEIEVRVTRGIVEVTSAQGETVTIKGGQSGTFPSGRVQPLTEQVAIRDQGLLRGEAMVNDEATTESAQPVVVGDLFRRAEKARRAGQCTRALGLYHRVQQAHPSGASAGTALISIGQLCLGSCRCPAKARIAFQTYATRHRGPMQQEALVGLMRAERSLGRTNAAQQAARRYLREYPRGRYVAMAREILGDEP